MTPKGREESEATYRQMKAEMAPEMIQYGYKYCLGCGKDLDGGMIPVELRVAYRADRYSLLRQRFDSHGDGLEYLECPECGERMIA